MSISRLYVHVQAACPCPGCISMSRLHAYVHTACPCLCFIFMSLLHVHVPLECPCLYAACPFCTDMGRWTWTDMGTDTEMDTDMDMDMNIYCTLTWTRTLSMVMDIGLNPNRSLSISRGGGPVSMIGVVVVYQDLRWVQGRYAILRYKLIFFFLILVNFTISAPVQLTTLVEVYRLQ
jgi:hypothetical protein